MKIRELLSDKSKWTKGAPARDAYGLRVPAYSKTAICWCLYGAIEHCYNDCDTGYRPYTALRAAIATKPPRYSNDIILWNDDPERTFDEVKELVDRLDI